MRNWRSILGLADKVKNSKDIPVLTDYLANNETFGKFSIGVHNIKLKFLHEVDKAAFPEKYKDAKFVD